MRASPGGKRGTRMSFDPAGRFAIVTGHASQVGHACAEVLADDGAKYARREVHLFRCCVDAPLRGAARRCPVGAVVFGPVAGS